MDEPFDSKGEKYPIVHSCQSYQYGWPSWVERMGKAGLTHSMSRKGCSPDDSACKDFFGKLNNGIFYGRPGKGVSKEKFITQYGHSPDGLP